MKYRLEKERTSALKSHPARSAWIEIDLPVEESEEPESHPARGAWIEIIISSTTR